MSSARPGGHGEQTAAAAWSTEVSLDGFAGELGHGRAAAFGFVAQSGIEVVGQT